jgi:hypothetical protein
MRTIGATAGARLPDFRIWAVAQLPDVVRVVLHFEHHAIVGGGADRLRRADLGRREGDESRLVAFEGADRRIEAWDVGHRVGS